MKSKKTLASLLAMGLSSQLALSAITPTSAFTMDIELWDDESIVVVDDIETTDDTNPEDTDPEVADPEDTDPEDTDPEDADTEDTDPEDTDTEDADTEDADTEDADPEVTDPEVTDPEDTDPEVTDPEVTDPEDTDPEVTDPEVTDPEVTDPEVTDPEVTDPENPDELLDPDFSVDYDYEIDPGFSVNPEDYIIPESSDDDSSSSDDYWEEEEEEEVVEPQEEVLDLIITDTDSVIVEIAPTLVNGVAVTEVSQQIVNQALDSLNDLESTDLVLNVVLSSAGSAQVEFSEESFASLLHAGVSISISTEIATLELDSHSISALSKELGDRPLQVSIATKTLGGLNTSQFISLSPTSKRHMIDFSVGAVGERFTEFSEPLTLSLPISNSNSKKTVEAYLFHTDGKKTALESSYEDGIATLSSTQSGTLVVELK